jgi:tRNA (cmo5U34)-methyltransferase
MTDIAESFPAGGWEFTPEVADVFDEHVRASVPFYEAIQNIVVETSDWLIPAGGLLADLGASTGTTVAAILARHPDREIRAALYDEQASMIEKARKRLYDLRVPPARVSFHERRVETGPLDHEDADLTTILFTLQFLPIPDRQAVLAAAFEAAAPTGALLVAEKLRPVDSRWAEIATEASLDWKAAHGISAEAIRAKARALRGVLIPFPLSTLTGLIVDAGWHTPEVLFRWHQWVVVGAFALPPDLDPIGRQYGLARRENDS